MTAVRLLVTDVDTALSVYCDALGFELVERWGPPFAIIAKDGVSVWLSGPGTSAQRELADGRRPVPGGWNRLVVPVSNLDAVLTHLADVGVEILSDPVTGPGGTQALVSDGAGNVIEIFQPSEPG